MRSKSIVTFFLVVAASVGALVADARLLVGGNEETPATSIILDDFSNPAHDWEEMNDPVMGGQSTGTFDVRDGLGRLHGEVKDVPFLHAPGFVQARATSNSFADISTCTHLELVVKNGTPEYDGYRVSFGRAHAPGGKAFAFGYKASIPASMFDGASANEFVTVSLPLDQFTDFWDDATGNPIHSCAENSLYCPDLLTLRNLRQLAVWGEGVNGLVDLSVKSIAGAYCSSAIRIRDE